MSGVYFFTKMHNQWEQLNVIYNIKYSYFQPLNTHGINNRQQCHSYI